MLKKCRTCHSCKGKSLRCPDLVDHFLWNNRFPMPKFREDEENNLNIISKSFLICDRRTNSISEENKLSISYEEIMLAKVP